VQRLRDFAVEATIAAGGVDAIVAAVFPSQNATSQDAGLSVAWLNV
jgi:hypothetical protein